MENLYTIFINNLDVISFAKRKIKKEMHQIVIIYIQFESYPSIRMSWS